MSEQIPDRSTLRSALALAVRAPSIHNTQPWRWRIGDRSVHLYADPVRWLPATDPDERDLYLSCGAVLHHARIALAATGWSGQVHRLPNPADPTHLAAIELHRHEPSGEELAMAAAIPLRRSDRRRYSTWPVPSSRFTEFATLAAHEGVVLELVDEPYARSVLYRAIEDADQAQRANPAYGNELRQWSGRTHIAEDGVPAANAPAAAAYGGLRLRAFDGTPRSAGHTSEEGGAGELLVLGTASDEAISRLRAGEATSAVLLAGTRDGLASCPLTQPLETIPTRQVVAQINGAGIVPQMVIRIGWPEFADDALPATPRRPLDAMLDRFRPGGE